MKRLFRGCVTLAGLVGLAVVAGCARDDANAGGTTLVRTTVVGDQSTVGQADFGSRYVGAPVAFWFWAPY